MLATSAMPRDNLGRAEFLLRLTDHVHGLTDPVEIQQGAARLLGEHLRVDRVGYAEVGCEGDVLCVRSEWRQPGIASLPGTWRVEGATESLLVIDDAAAEQPAVAERMPPLQAPGDSRSAVIYRLVRQSRLVAALFVHQCSPRHWTEAEITLVRETGERMWAAVEQARALEQLRLSELKYRRLFESIDAGFCIIEVLFDAAQQVVDFRYLETNAAFERHTGLHNAAGRTARELTPQLEQHWFDAYGHVALKGESARFEAPAESLGRWYEVCAFRIGEPEQRRVAILFDEVTRRVLNEAALLESEERCRALAAESARLLDAERVARCAADRAVSAKDEFLMTVSHELRAPLANIVAWSRLLRTRFMEDEQTLRKGLVLISDNALSLGRLLSGLLDSCRISKGKFELEPEELDLNELLASVHAGMLPAAEGRGISLECQVMTDPAPLYADATRLRQVMDNLLSNAIKFTPAGGTVRLSGSKGDDGRYLIEVRDSGEGIDAELLPHVFDRFRQADSARTRGRGGLGLGLSIAREIVEMHGGTLLAESEGRGRGSRFVVTLPMRVGSAGLPANAEAASMGGLRSLDGLRILVVEDEVEMRDLMKRILEEHGARVSVADSAPEALAQLRLAESGPAFDALISDIGLPSLDGNQFIRIVRRELGLDAGRLPAMAVTAYARQEDRQRALDAGFQEHLTKPYSPQRLVALVKQLASSRQNPAS